MAADATSYLAAVIAANNLGIGYLFVKGVIVRGSELDKKDAALERKDEQIQKLNDQNQALNKGLVDTAVPALARAALILEKYHTDTTVRRSE